MGGYLGAFKSYTIINNNELNVKFREVEYTTKDDYGISLSTEDNLSKYLDTITDDEFFSFIVLPQHTTIEPMNEEYLIKQKENRKYIIETLEKNLDLKTEYDFYIKWIVERLKKDYFVIYLY